MNQAKNFLPVAEAVRDSIRFLSSSSEEIMETAIMAVHAIASRNDLAGPISKSVDRSSRIKFVDGSFLSIDYDILKEAFVVTPPSKRRTPDGLVDKPDTLRLEYSNLYGWRWVYRRNGVWIGWGETPEAAVARAGVENPVEPEY